MAFVVGHRDSLHQVAGCGAAVARAHGGDLQAGGPAQVVGRSDVRAGHRPLRPGGEFPGGGPAVAVLAVVGALEAVMPGAGRTRGSARMVVVCAFPGEGFDGPVEPVPGRASDHVAFDGPADGSHDEPALDLAGKSASCCTVLVQVGRAVKDDHLTSVYHKAGALPGCGVGTGNGSAACRVTGAALAEPGRCVVLAV